MLLNFQCNDMERLRAPGHHTNISRQEEGSELCYEEWQNGQRVKGSQAERPQSVNRTRLQHPMNNLRSNSFLWWLRMNLMR